MAVIKVKTHYRAYFEKPCTYFMGPVKENILEHTSLDAELLFEYEADTPEEAMAIYQLRLGFGAFLPMGDPEPCPKCGAIYYPGGSSICWHCGPVGYETSETALLAPDEYQRQDEFHGRFRYIAYLDQSGEVNLYSQSQESDARANGQIALDAQPLWEIEVDTPEEAMTIYQLRMGLEPYTPKGEARKCPNCGAVYYPKDSGVCWRCGPIR
jgi:hypothetical protein